MKSHYYLQGSFLALIGMLMFSAAAVYGSEESITLTTYYPSPYGVYGEMRLYPKASAICNGTQRGLMYYDDAEDRFKFCAGTPADWQGLGGGYWAASHSNPNNIYNTNSGNVGIGTSDPQVKLHVVGGIIAVNMGSGLNSQIMGGDGVSSGFMLRNAGSTYAPSGIMITPDRVGIDTYDPKAKLEVVGAAPQFRITGAGATYKHIELKDSTTNEIWQFSHRPNSEGNRLDTWYYDEDDIGGTAKMVTSITKAGNFGIGRVPNNARLHINSNGMAGGVADYNIFSEYIGTALFNVKNSGNVGIGIADPQVKLHVVGGIIAVNMGSGLNSQIMGGDGVSSGFMLRNAGSTYAPSGIMITPDRVGIDTYTPGYKLEVNGSAGKPGGGSWSASCDARLKTNITPIAGALDKIKSLKGVQFEWKNPEEHSAKTNEIRAGFLAQEVEKIFPQFISEIDASGKDKELTPDGKIKSLALPFDFDAYLVEATKEQQKQIEELKAENDALKARLDEVERKLK